MLVRDFRNGVLSRPAAHRQQVLPDFVGLTLTIAAQ